VRERAGRGSGWLGRATEADMQSDGAGAVREGGLWPRTWKGGGDRRAVV
jgi:hypothetical protein